MLEIIFPENIDCIFCNMPISKGNKYSICRECFEKLEFIEEICIKCGRSGENSCLCTHCYSEHYYYDKILSVLKYNDFMHRIMYGYKYGHKNYLSKYFAEMVIDFINSNNIEYDYITSVPISDARMKKRGFNQTDIIARKLCSSNKYVELFTRIKHTEFLSKLSNVARISEIEGAFEIKDDVLDYIVQSTYSRTDINIESNLEINANIKSNANIKIIIFDDIFTTGSTLNELSKSLKKSLAGVEIIGLTLCNARDIKKAKS